MHHIGGLGNASQGDGFDDLFKQVVVGPEGLREFGAHHARCYGVDLDIEWRQAPQMLSQLKFGNYTELILSHHTEVSDPEKLELVLRKMLDLPARIYKLVYRAGTLNDCMNVPGLTNLVENFGKEFIIHAMGEEGQASRLIGAVSGNAWTYVSHPDSTVTADGQINIEKARNFSSSDATGK